MGETPMPLAERAHYDRLAMTYLHATSALTPDGWRPDVRVGIDGGVIASIEIGARNIAGKESCGVLIPAMPNVHSHAFQRGMAGLAEVRGPVEDNFWSWRQVMYRFALTMSPDDAEAVAAQVYMEMLEAGFGRVGEFHYLHHDRDGRPYGDIAEMAMRIAAAASDTGIGLTLLPVFYAHSTFSGAAPTEGQRRFICDIDSFAKLLSQCREIAKGIPGANVGVAPHSLRAVTPDELVAVVVMEPTGPIHIHAAEQVKEVDDCLAWSGARPIEWLLDHANVDRRWCLIHSTHMTADETRRLAASGAMAGLCPVTEANLGDGIFPGVEFLAAKGHFGIGTDSNVLIGVVDELRQLEYAQRLQNRLRNMTAHSHESTGRALFDHALRGGAAALGAATGLVVGNSADFLSLDITSAPYVSGDTILDSWIFTNAIRPDSVWVRGNKIVTGGRHVHRDRIESRFRATMRGLMRSS